MSTEAELYTLAFWKSAIARSVSAAAAAASSVLINARADSLHDVAWYGVVSTAILAGLIILSGLIGGAGIRDIAPGNPASTAEAIASWRSTGKHAKRDDDEPTA
ncbi:hypothetical protein [Mycolicibacter heraklionensis]|uniref:hypothetical protein n=1 Tax=Mycolicibacter heraklionensis TaxID=512402 RepID=UPI0007E969BD|nr:hypothetical protein [Mycolicibacter heraklionensis]OBG32440.1 hypothetical protein A5671_07880 [Mycolicibacter heraklionensis]